MNRNASLDMLRGYALVCIMLNHMPAGILRAGTLTNLAVFDAAELFVLLSGFLVGVVWLKTQATQGLRAAQWRFARRAVQVWLALAVGSVLLALLSGALTSFGLMHTAVWSGYADWLAHDPLAYLGIVLTLWMQPNLVDVLALYVVLIAAVPLALPLLTRRPLIFAALSVGLWLAARPLNAFLPNERDGGGLLFNPFAWQLLFFAGVTMGAFRRPIMDALLPRARIVTAVAGFVAAYSVGMAVLWRFGAEGKHVADLMWHAVGTVDKWTLDWVRLVSVLAWAWVVAVPLARPLARFSATLPGRALATTGRGGLVSFVACVLLSLLGDALSTNFMQSDTAWRLTVDLFVIVALWLVAAAWLNRDRILPAGAARASG